LAAEAERARLIEELGQDMSLAFKQTKPHIGPLSPGCRTCGEGGWSCLFINGKCNCRCFYCPTSQDDLGLPTTNRMIFARPGDYADYVRHFGFRGVSISGGEPLLTLDRTLTYLDALRRKPGDALHVWLYTNGTLLTDEIVGRLADAGLDEIRFDLSAAAYDLKTLKLAVGRIACVTVEIPAIPEDVGQVANLLAVLKDVGVNHLNLHQLRLTPHNSARLKTRPYTFLHGEKVTVLESELAALALIQEAATQGVGLPINYCSFVYKHRYQGAAARRRNARFIAKGHETITESGFIRTLAASGDPQAIGRQAEILTRRDINRKLWSPTGQKDRLFFHETLWPLIDFCQCELRLTYAEAVLSPNLSYRCAFKEIRLNSDKSLYIEKHPLSIDLPVDRTQRELFEKRFIQKKSILPADEGTIDPAIAGYESIQPHLQDYF
jgi:pyruvate formate-lyase activating enzyme-like uncharacterized protein